MRDTLYLLQSNSQSNVSCCHRLDFNMLISKRNQQPAHPLAAQDMIEKKI